MPIAHTRAMLEAALGGAFDDVSMRNDPVFGLAVPVSCPGVPADLLDPRTAPGLEWGDPMDVLKIPAVDLVGPLTAQSAVEPSPHSPKPWIDRFRSEAVARFHPELEGVADWRLIVTADDGAEMAVLGPLRGGLSFRF